MIKAEHLQKSFGGKAVLNDISFHIEKGEIFGIVGHSGAGKSTLLRCLNGLEPFDGGMISVMEKSVSALDMNGLKELRRNMGMIFQNFNLMARKNVFENVAFPLQVWKTPKNEICRRVEELLDLVGLSEKSGERIQSLSGGQKQRVGIARALALSPQILLCDEATSALDPNTTISILDLLQDINERLGLTIVIVTHQMEVVKRVCRRLLLLDGGVAQCMGKTEDLFISSVPALRKFVEDEYTIIPSGINIRLMFNRQTSQQAVVTGMARELDIDFSIVGGKLDRYLDDVLGFLFINIATEDLERVGKYLTAKQIGWEVVKYDR